MKSSRQLEDTDIQRSYSAYEYLTPGVDYEDFELVPEMGLFPPLDDLGLSESQEQVADRLLNEILIFSLHDHPSVLPRDLSRYRDLTRTGRDRTAYAALAASGLSAFFDNFLACSTYITSQSGWKWDDVLFDLGMRYSDLAHQDLVVRAETVPEVLQAHENGQIALVAGLETATPIENEIDRIDVLYGFGVRQMGLVYSETNALGGGLKERHDGGLTYFGERAVERMNRLGMAVDISHCGDATSVDAITRSNAPVLITHAGARSVWPTRRMKPDSVIRACAERGGVIGIEAAPHTTISRQHLSHSLHSVMDHFEYLVDLVGIDHVTFGPDTIVGDHVGLHAAERVWQSNPDPFGLTTTSSDDTDLANPVPEHPRVTHVAGLDNPSESFRNIVRWLVLHDYSEGEITAVMGANTIRVLEEIWR